MDDIKRSHIGKRLSQVAEYRGVIEAWLATPQKLVEVVVVAAAA